MASVSPHMRSGAGGRTRPEHPGPSSRRALLIGIQFLIPIGLLLRISPATELDYSIGYTLKYKLLSPFVPTLFYEEAIDFVLFGLVVGIAVVAWVRGWLHFDRVMLFPVIALAIASLLIPSWFIGNYGNGFRLVLPMVLILIAGCHLNAQTPRMLLAVVATVVILRVTSIADDWLKYDAMFAELRSAGMSLNAGDRVLPVMQNRDRIGSVAPTSFATVFYNASSFLVLDSDIYVPDIFTTKGRSPLVVRPAANVVDVPYMAPMEVGMLNYTADPTVRERLFLNRAKGRFDYRFAGWWKKFDYVLDLDFGAPRNPMPSRLTEIRQGTFFTIYAVTN